MPNPPITYNPTFQHQDWVDNVDRVQAGGDNGFNLRFHGLEAEFGRLHDVVAAINTQLEALGVKPTPQPEATSLAPVFVATAVNAWAAQPGLAMKPPNQTAARGMMSIDLPNGQTIVSFRASGRNTGTGTLHITLFRQGVTGNAGAADQIVDVPGAGDPFDVSAPAPATLARIDTSQFKYFITASIDNAQAADIVMITGLQIVHVAS